MSGRNARPKRDRKSIAIQPNTAAATAAAVAAANAPSRPVRKSRSKSLGPGGIEALNANETEKEVLTAINENSRRASVGS